MRRSSWRCNWTLRARRTLTATWPQASRGVATPSARSRSTLTRPGPVCLNAWSDGVHRPLLWHSVATWTLIYEQLVPASALNAGTVDSRAFTDASPGAKRSFLAGEGWRDLLPLQSRHLGWKVFSARAGGLCPLNQDTSPLPQPQSDFIINSHSLCEALRHFCEALRAQQETGARRFMLLHPRPPATTWRITVHAATPHVMFMGCSICPRAWSLPRDQTAWNGVG